MPLKCYFLSQNRLHSNLPTGKNVLSTTMLYVLHSAIYSTIIFLNFKIHCFGEFPAGLVARTLVLLLQMALIYFG